MTEYQFSLPREERLAVARGIARMQGLDPEASKAKNDGKWDGCLMWAGVIILTKQYMEQSARLPESESAEWWRKLPDVMAETMREVLREQKGGVS